MKLEKLTDNKIRIILNSQDFKENNINPKTFLNTSLRQNSFFIYMLKRAKKELGFNPKGYDLMVELFLTVEDDYIFTLTKFHNQTQSAKSSTLPISKTKELNNFKDIFVYQLDDFDSFCNLCEYLANSSISNIKKISNCSSLYLYNNTYYLLIKNTKYSPNELNNFYYIISEFITTCDFSENFTSKLIEHGKALIKKGAIMKGINLFVKSNYNS